MKKTVSADRLKETDVRKLLVWGIPFIIVTSYMFLALQPDLRLAVPGMLGGTAVILIMLTITLYAGEQGKLAWSPGIILITAFILRMMFLFHAPELSDDIYRYLWDGLQTMSGQNPYSLAPSQAMPHGRAAASLLGHINHPDLVTIYPPFAQLIFACGTAIAHSLTGLKTLLVALDLGACFMMIKILSSMKLPAWRASLYAWHPLPVLEIAGSGHVDGAGMLFVFITVYILFLRHAAAGSASDLTTRSRTISGTPFFGLLAGLAFAAAVLVKLIPLIYLPLLLIAVAGSGRVLFIIGFLAGLTLLAIPFLPELENMTLTLGIYLQNWEFSNFAFRTIRDLLSSGSGARLALLILLSVAIVVLSVSFLKKKRERTVQGMSLLFMKTIYGVTFCFLLLTPTLYPWYALYLAGLLPFAAGTAGLVLSWTVFLSYHVQIRYLLLRQWNENDLIAAVIWLAPVLAFFIVRGVKRLVRRKVAFTDL